MQRYTVNSYIGIQDEQSRHLREPKARDLYKQKFVYVQTFRSLVAYFS